MFFKIILNKTLLFVALLIMHKIKLLLLIIFFVSLTYNFCVTKYFYITINWYNMVRLFQFRSSLSSKNFRACLRIYPLQCHTRWKLLLRALAQRSKQANSLKNNTCRRSLKLRFQQFYSFDLNETLNSERKIHEK